MNNRFKTRVVKVKNVLIGGDNPIRIQSMTTSRTDDVENTLKQMPDITSIIMSAQDHALPFYKKLGSQVTGEGYIEEGIPHHKIERRVT